MKVVKVCAHTYESNCVSDVNAVFAQSKFHTFPIDSIRVSRSSNSQLDALCKGKQAQGERGGRGVKDGSGWLGVGRHSSKVVVVASDVATAAAATADDDDVAGNLLWFNSI